jgi:formate/nitrite transporter FocA (FNT family)
MLSPAATFEAMRSAAVARAPRPLAVVFCSAVAAGALLSAGGALVVTVVGGSPQLLAAAPGMAKLLAGLLFPVGLQTILFLRADLLTSAMAHYALPALLAPSAAAGAPSAARVAALVLTIAAGNLAGSLVCAAGFSALLAGPGAAAAASAGFVAASAAAKCALPFGTAVMKGIAANFLVNVAVYMAAAAKSPGGKVLALWPPIATFVVLGLEHSVANAFLLPLAAFGGAVSWADVAGNLVPVALGNYAGALMFAGYALLSAPPSVRAAALAAAARWGLK